MRDTLSGVGTAEPYAPTVSVIIPVRNCPAELSSCLEGLRASLFKDYEIIVVDDASTDDTPEVATQNGIRLIRLQRQCGPAAARNQGAGVARGEYLLFLDADVCVYPETVGQLVEAFARQPAADAVFGSYDAHPGAPNFLSQYKNLSHHFVHQAGREQASTFWSGCGAIRRSVFAEVGGFDASYRRSCIEDIELGVRLRKAGYRILLDKRVQVTHWKRWSFWSLVKSDVCDRAIPWTQLLLRERILPNDLNLKLSQRISMLLADAFLALFVVGVWYLPGSLLLPVVGLLGILGLDHGPDEGWGARALRALWVVSVLGTLGWISLSFKMWTLVGLACPVGLMLINLPYYAFFVRQRGVLFAALVVPLHLVYYLYSGVAFALGVWLYVRGPEAVPSLASQSSRAPEAAVLR
jgi:GT2 family glycosyltransferase